MRFGSLPFAALGVVFSFACLAQKQGASVPLHEVGPYLVHAIEGGPELKKPMLVGVTSAWSEWAWVKADAFTAQETVLVAGVGDVSARGSRYLALDHGKPGIWLGQGSVVASSDAVEPGAWHLLGAVSDGAKVSLYVDGRLAGSGDAAKEMPAAQIVLAPSGLDGLERFSGAMGFYVADRAMSAEEMQAAFAARPDFAAWTMEENAKAWPVQTHGITGLRAPQGPELMPHGAPAQKPVAKPLPAAGPTLSEAGSGVWEFARNWRLLSNEGEHALKPEDGAKVSQAGFDDASWMVATVPGTVLTTMIDRGIYPDPDYGLNNMAIPESLNKHDYWYRVVFPTPKSAAGRKRSLEFAGINYTADVWLNGKQVGSMRGAFKRGEFDVTKLLRASGENVLAVRVAPALHPGIPHEQSIKGGRGENGGIMVIDGPTFMATEGWDWIPGIRDRNTGIWQGVSLHESGAVTLGDPQIVTKLPLPETSSADVELHLPVHNSGAAAARVVVTAEFEGVKVRMPATVAVGDSTLHLLPKEFAALHLEHPRLWWPNGYGRPELYHLKLQVESVAGGVSDAKAVTFGVREMSYEFSLFDHEGRLKLVEAVPTETRALGFNPVDVRHEAMRQTSYGGWASSMMPQAEGTKALLPVTNEPGMTDLVIKVNGVRIAARGGNWGMDDSRKRVTRAKLEPYFRLEHDANLNIIRNWQGQNTEEVFYELADEYGMMVWNDFFAVTQDSNAEPGDPQLFTDNARDVVRHYRNHPSVAVWCARNEGVPSPVLNEQLIAMMRKEDGTRFYSPSSNQVNLRPSGPYMWQQPELYFTKLDKGFAVELGISSFPTLESFEAAIAPQDRWPLSDAWAYHDWHQDLNGNVHELEAHMATQLGESKSLPEFERRIQMFNYVDHQAIYEGFYQHLWSPNSGRMIWMTHPSWPSTMWQMYSADYDTQASYYGVKKANQPLHVQMDPSNYEVAAVNTTREAMRGVTVTARVYSAENKLLDTETSTQDLEADTMLPLMKLPMAKVYAASPLVLVRLEMKDASGALLADNFYWMAQKEEAFQGLNKLPAAQVSVHAVADAAVQGAERVTRVALKNEGSGAAIELKLTMLHADGSRVLPVYYGDNYVSLLPGEEREVVVRVPEGAAGEGAMHLAVRGYNLVQRDVAIR